MSIRLVLLCLAATIAIGASLFKLEQARNGIEIDAFYVGQTPVTRYRLPETDAPIVVVAHGFAGSTQIMQAYSLTLAQAGYEVLAFDFEGHGRNSVPMSGDVTSIDGTTRLLVLQTSTIIKAVRQMDNAVNGIALLGHSMATDVLLRALIAEQEAGNSIETMVGISMFSEVVNESTPSSLLIINGQWEKRLREPALAQLQLLDPDAGEGESVTKNGVVRRVVVAPNMEHVGVLYSEAAISEALMWLNLTFNRDSMQTPVRMGGWILLLLLGIVLLFKPLVSLLPTTHARYPEIPAPRYWAAIVLPAIVTPLLALLPGTSFLPVLVADYLMLHLGVYGLLQLLLIRTWPAVSVKASVYAALVLIFWGVVIFGVSLDRYAASFLPTAGRLNIIIVLSVSAVVFMLADAMVTGAGRGRLSRRLVARMALFVSLAAAAFIDSERLIFLVLILPVLLVFYLIYGLMGRWVAQRCGVLASGLGLGVCLAWALGVSFPLFV